MRKQPKARTTKSKSRQDDFDEIEDHAKQKIEVEAVTAAGEDEPVGR